MKEKDFGEFEKIIGVKFKNKDLLTQALTHRSFLNENKNLKGGHNERLEFLGDAVLELVITNYLYEKYPEKNEGDMTSIRSALVNATTCAEVAKKLNLNDFLLLSRGEAKDVGRARQYILANALEAIIGAIYIDAGYEKALSAIVDSNLTTLIAAAFLFQFGTGPVKGFAVTLTLGIMISMFTAIIVTHLIFDYTLAGKDIKKLSI